MARQVLFGELPSRDFFDPGRPLKYYLSAAVLWISGHNLLGEALFVTTCVAAGTTVVYALATRLSRSAILGLLAAGLTLAMGPRPYAYPKVILPALAVALAWRYLARPSRGSLSLLALITAVSALIRSDYGLYVGILATVAVFGAGLDRRLVTGARQWLRYAGVTLVLLSPQLVFLGAAGLMLESGGGVGRLVGAFGSSLASVRPFRFDGQGSWITVETPSASIYVRWRPAVDARTRAVQEQIHGLEVQELDGDTTYRYTLTDPSRENLRALVANPNIEDTAGFDRATSRLTNQPFWRRVPRRLGLPVVVLRADLFSRHNVENWLYSCLFALPFIAAVRVWWLRGQRQLHPEIGVLVLGTAAMALAMNLLLIRGNFDSRLPDVIVPAALLIAWLVARPPHGGRGAPSAETRAGPRLVVWGRSLGLLLIVLVTVKSIAVYGDLADRLESTGLSRGPMAVAQRLSSLTRVLAGDPLESLAPAGSGGRRGLTRWIRACTAPADRVLFLGYGPDVYFLAERRFAGGLVTVPAGFDRLTRQDQLAADALRRQRPIIVFGDSAGRVSGTAVGDYIEANYDLVAQSAFGGGETYHVWVRAGDRPVSAYPPFPELPCFRSR